MLSDGIQYKIAISGIELDSKDSCKKFGSLTLYVAIKIKTISFQSQLCDVAAALSERKNIETYLTIVNEKLLSL